MKKLLFLFFASVLIISCSPKYTASFQNYDHSYSTKKKIELQPLNELTSVAPETREDHALISSAEVLQASKENKPALSKEESPKISVPKELNQLSKKETKQLKKQAKKEFKSSLREVKKQNSPKEGGYKNGLAIAGFVSSIVGLFVLWPLCVLGIIFSAIGLKSERKGLAIAGLIIGIVGVVLVLAFGAALAAAA